MGAATVETRQLSQGDRKDIFQKGKEGSPSIEDTLTHRYSKFDASNIIPLRTAVLLAEDSVYSMHIEDEKDEWLVKSGNEKSQNYFDQFQSLPVPRLLTRSFDAKNNSTIDVQEDPLKMLLEERDTLDLVGKSRPDLAGRIFATYIRNKLHSYSTYKGDNASLNGDLTPLSTQIDRLRILDHRSMIHGNTPISLGEIDEILLSEMKNPTLTPQENNQPHAAD